MDNSVIDAHIHFDKYKRITREKIIKSLDKYHIDALISVSINASSARDNLKLSKENSKVKPAFGFHPEQTLPDIAEVEMLLKMMDTYHSQMVAVGEVGLPFYLRKENQELPQQPYIRLLETFIRKAKQLAKPIILHAVYKDAPIVCSLLEEYSIEKAHFHWFKGDEQTTERMIQNGYFISFTPDIIYKPKRDALVKKYPLTQMMVETDGPWPFDGPFKNILTHSRMVHLVIKKIAEIKQIEEAVVYQQIYENTKAFYSI